MLKKGLAWHYKAYDKRPELEKVVYLYLCLYCLRLTIFLSVFFNINVRL